MSAIRRGKDQEHLQIDSDMKKVFLWGINRAKQFNQTFLTSFKEALLCQNRREKKLKEKMFEQFERHLDIRKIRNSQMALTTLIRRLLTN